MAISASQVFNTVSGSRYTVTIFVIIYFCVRKGNGDGALSLLQRRHRSEERFDMFGK